MGNMKGILNILYVKKLFQIWYLLNFKVWQVNEVPLFNSIPCLHMKTYRSSPRLINTSVTFGTALGMQFDEEFQVDEHWNILGVQNKKNAKR